MTEKVGRKQTAISLKMKMELLKAVDEKRRSKTEICKEFGIANSTLSTIIKNRDQITVMFECSMFEPERKRMRTAKHEDLETALLVWFKQARSQNDLISGPLLLERADELAKQLGIDFSANPGWLERFKKRNGIVLKNICVDVNPVLPSTPTNWLLSTLPSVLEEYDAKDVFNADETSLFYSYLPNETLPLEEKQCPEGKNKERVTVLIGCNSDGSEKLPLFVIGKSLKHCLKNARALPVDYTANRKAWMVPIMFTNWILNLDKRFLQEKRKVAIIVKSCPAHPEVKLKAIKLIFLPQNVSQPCDQGVKQNLKFHYRKQLLQKYLLSVEAKEDFSVDLLETMKMLSSAWDLVTAKTIENCFRQAGFSKVVDSLAPQDLVDIETEPTFNEIFENVSTLIDCTVSPDEFVSVDDNDLCTAPFMADEDILEIIQSYKDPVLINSNDESDNVEVTVPTTSEMRKMLKSMRSYLDAHSNGEMNRTMDDIEQFVENLMLKNILQKKSII